MAEDKKETEKSTLGERMGDISGIKIYRDGKLVEMPTPPKKP